MGFVLSFGEGSRVGGLMGLNAGWMIGWLDGWMVGLSAELARFIVCEMAPIVVRFVYRAGMQSASQQAQQVGQFSLSQWASIHEKTPVRGSLHEPTTEF